jgi:hypothetical protein
MGILLIDKAEQLVSFWKQCPNYGPYPRFRKYEKTTLMKYLLHLKSLKGTVSTKPVKHVDFGDR